MTALSSSEPDQHGDVAEVDARLEKLNKQGQTHIAELQKMGMPQLIEEARKENLAEVSGMKRQDLIFPKRRVMRRVAA
mgnify:CR=1 FL=1